MTAYLDHAATTPMLPEARAVMIDELGRTGNASSLHTAGRRARRVVEEAREQIAEVLGAGASEVIFTAGGTEADNLAIKGLYAARQAADAHRRRVLVSAVEHHAVIDPAEALGARGADVDLIPVDGAGRVDVAALRELLETDAGRSVALISVMWANNEVGTIQPVGAVVALGQEFGIPVHVDAVQAVGALPVDLAASGADCITVSAHKIGGPIGVGALLARRGVDLAPVLHGGGQERGVRSGTPDTPSIAAFGVATALAAEHREATTTRVRSLRDRLVEGVLAAVPGAVLRGDPDPAGRLPGHAHLTFGDCEGDSLLYLLDARGVEVSTGSACQAGVPQPSHVLLAMGIPEREARGAVRFSLGHTSTEGDVDAALAAIGPVVERARRAGLASSGVAK